MPDELAALVALDLEPGVWPIISGQPLSFHSARIAVSVGCTGMYRVRFVLVWPLS
jgi:hypothetical protein